MTPAFELPAQKDEALAFLDTVLRENYPCVWRVRTRLPERFGQRCRVLCRGRMNSCAVEFEDGCRVVTSRWYVRRAAPES